MHVRQTRPTHPSRRPGNGPRRGPRPEAATSRRAPREPDALELAFQRALAEAPPAATSFAELGLPQPLVDTLAQAGISTPFAIQSRAIPDALAGRDILGRGQTGSGKTLAFGLPLLTRLAERTRPPRARGVHASPATPGGLILAPTRELAQQVRDALTPLARALGLHVIAVYGGAPIARQIEGLRRGPDVVVATPGRLLDLIRRQALTLAGVVAGVVDEADHMADLGFLPDVTAILDQTPAGSQRLLFSATLDNGVGQLVTRYLTDPATHAVAPAAAGVETMDHRAFVVRREDKSMVAAEIAKRPARTLFFVRTQAGASELSDQLRAAGVDADAIHGGLPQAVRQKVLRRFTEGSRRVLVATDVAARGLHVDGLDLVVHYDPANDHKDYLHRSGRTARAGADGVVLSLLAPHEVRYARRMQQLAGVELRATDVTPGDQPVRELAESGEAVVVVRQTRERWEDDGPLRRARPARGQGGQRRQASGRGGERRPDWAPHEGRGSGGRSPYRGQGRPRQAETS